MDDQPRRVQPTDATDPATPLPPAPLPPDTTPTRCPATCGSQDTDLAMDTRIGPATTNGS
jgi:hypothetical protein